MSKSPTPPHPHPQSPFVASPGRVILKPTRTACSAGTEHMQFSQWAAHVCPAPPLALPRKSICCLWVFRLGNNLLFQASEDCWPAFCSISDNSELFVIHYINLGQCVEQANQASLVWTQKRMIHTPLPFVLRQLFFPSGWMICTFNIPGEKVSVI